jgi:acyl-CoA thioesterase I
MSWFTLHLGSGAAFFSGTAILTLALVLNAGLSPKRAGLRIVAWVLALVGVLLVACSATPLPWWAYAAWATVLIPAMVLCSTRGRQRGSLLLAIVAGLAGVAIAVAEARHHTRPTVPTGAARTLYVVGDSLSAGMGDEGAPTWPELLRLQHGIEVVNLSRGGAIVATALRELDRHPPLGDGVVLLEIGGNDQFGRTPTAEFERNLATLIDRVSGQGRHVVLFELPLFPLNNGYGRAQRRLAAERGVVLIPKRYLVDVIAPADATTDGVHLTAAGHRRMAESVWNLISPTFRP